MSNRRIYQLSHYTYTCQYHFVWTPRFRERVLADTYIKQELKRIFKQIAKWKNFKIHEWHIGDDHIHLYITIPPKYSVSYAANILKGKSSAWIKKKTNKIPKGSLWNRGYYVTTTGLNEYAVRMYVRNQDHHKESLQKLPFVD